MPLYSSEGIFPSTSFDFPSFPQANFDLEGAAFQGQPFSFDPLSLPTLDPGMWSFGFDPIPNVPTLPQNVFFPPPEQFNWETFFPPVQPAAFPGGDLYGGLQDYLRPIPTPAMGAAGFGGEGPYSAVDLGMYERVPSRFEQVYEPSAEERKPGWWERLTTSPTPTLPEGATEAQKIAAMIYGRGPTPLQNILGLGQFGLGLGGALFSAFGQETPKPRPQTPEEAALLSAQAEESAARAALAARTDPNIRAETPGPRERVPLFGMDPRFGTLFEDVTAAEPEGPVTPQVTQMALEIAQPQLALLEEEFAKRERELLELEAVQGINVSGPRAELEKEKLRRVGEIQAQAQRTAIDLSQNRQNQLAQILSTILGTVV